MIFLTETFKTSTRNDIISICSNIAESIQLQLINSPNKSITIRINGSNDSGKTLVWDSIRNYLTPNAKLDKNQTHRTNCDLLGYHRDYETWHGNMASASHPITIFCADASNITEQMASRIINKNGKPLGELVIVNNTNMNSFFRRKKFKPDIEISLTTPKKLQGEWERVLKLTITCSSMDARLQNPSNPVPKPCTNPFH